MEIRDAAEKILYEMGLMKVLEKYGTPHPVGSYLINAMAWEDIDISMECEDAVPETLYALSDDINRLMKPYFYEARVISEETMFYSCETKVEDQRWNLDIWFRKKEAVAATLMHCAELKQKIAEKAENREHIIAIKQGLAARGMYGIDKDPHRHYHSRDVYRAVLEDGIRDTETFLAAYTIQEER